MLVVLFILYTIVSLLQIIRAQYQLEMDDIPVKHTRVR